MSILGSIRPVNLIIITVTMVVVKYGFIKTLGISGQLSIFQFVLLIMSTVCIAAGGYLINDFYDVQADRINGKIKQSIPSHKKSRYNYLLFTTLGITIGCFISFTIHQPKYSLIFVAVALLLFAYAHSIKKWLIVNNALIAFLTAFTIVLVALFDIFPIKNNTSLLGKEIVTQSIIYIALAAFYLNFIREVVKDIEDINGDFVDNRKTFAIALGRDRATMLVFWITAIGFLISLLITFSVFKAQTFLQGYTLLLVSFPLLVICKMTWDASSNKDFKKISNLLKLTMVTGLGILMLLPHTLFS